MNVSSPDDEFTPVEKNRPSVEETQQQSSWLSRRLSTENPFYLLSAAFVIHSTGLSLDGGLPLQVLLSLIGGYLLLLVIISLGIVHFWKVWDDARSIFLILILLMLELSICFDQAISQKQVGAVYSLLAIAAASLLVAESILRILKIRLPGIYRIPLYLQLSLAMLASLIPMVFSSSEDGMLVRWAIYGVSLLAGLSMLTLIPAIRTSRERVEFHGCPWIWPYHPWSLFVIVWCCLGFRLYLLTISFDPVIELSSAAAYAGMGGIFGGYLLTPMIMGISWLLLEAAIAHRHWFMQTLALSLPFGCIALSVQPWNANSALRGFVAEHTAFFGSPVWVAAMFSVLFYFVAWKRRVPFARRSLVVAMLLMCKISPTTNHWETIRWQAGEQVNLYWLFAVVGFLILVGLQRKNSRFLLESVGWLLIGLGARDLFDGWIFSPMEIQFHLFALSIIMLSMWFRDEAMEEFKVLLIWYLVLASGRMVLHSFLGIRPLMLPSADLFILAIMAATMNYFHHQQGFKATAIFVASCCYASWLAEGGRFLTDEVNWRGMQQFLIGLGLLHLGVLASAWKGGFFHKWISYAGIDPEEESSSIG
ncbi:MAG: hypothetical protein HON04_12165 [Planctomicrobium sp.]|nr:hypothetical protein [Planctomicrobium sp.]